MMNRLLVLVLISATAVAAPPPITPGAVFSVTRLAHQKILATGTWRSFDRDRPVAEPINTVSIACNGQARQCIEAEAYIGDARRLRIRSAEFRITQWGPDEISAEKTERCTRETLVLNLARKVAYKSIRATPSAGCTPEELDRYRTPLMYELSEPTPP